MRCPRCGTEMMDGSCPNCGYSIKEKGKSKDDSQSLSKNILRYITLISVLLFVGFMVFNTSAMLWLIKLILPKTLYNSSVIYLVSPIPMTQDGKYYFALGLFKINGYPFGIYYIGIIGAIFLSYIAMFYEGTKGFLEYLTETLKNDKDGPDKLKGPLMRVACVFAALLFISYVYYMGLELLGTSPTTPSGLEDSPLWQLAYSLTNAAVWEEIVVRVIYIGIPMVIYAKIKGHKNAKKFLIGGFGLKSRFIIILIIFSSTLFSLAHLASWDLTKIFPTFVAGIGFGYLFAKDGLYSAIILHFVWDYMSIPEEILNIPNYNMYFGLLLLFWIAVGGYYSYYFIKHTFKWFFNPEEKEEKLIQRTDSEKEKVSGTAGASFAYVCPNCGNGSAVYTDDSKLKCKRCGEESDPSSNSYRQRNLDKRRTGWPPS
ncbi:MAG: type II CAAX prenyl endopeptidase Rce1 family protein [Thermoplasmatota archaeon]